MLIGAPYYSECWSIGRYSFAAQLMAVARFNVDRMGEFAPLNYTDKTHRVGLSTSMRDPFSDTVVDRQVVVPGNGEWVLLGGRRRCQRPASGSDRMSYSS